MLQIEFAYLDKWIIPEFDTNLEMTKATDSSMNSPGTPDNNPSKNDKKKKVFLYLCLLRNYHEKNR